MGIISSPLPLSSGTSCQFAFSTLWWHSRQSHWSPNPVALLKQFPSVLKPPFRRLYFVSNLKQSLNLVSDSKVLLFPLSPLLPRTAHPISTQAPPRALPWVLIMNSFSTFSLFSWPLQSHCLRLEILEEAVEIISFLWSPLVYFSLDPTQPLPCAPHTHSNAAFSWDICVSHCTVWYLYVVVM